MAETIIFHDTFYNSDYAADPAAAPGRIESIVAALEASDADYRFISPEPAKEEDLLRAHTRRHVNRIKADPRLYEVASLAAGAAIRSAEEAFDGTPSFALLRPPGHHASSDSCWGFCYFNNISVSLLKLYHEKKILSAYVLDFDLHTGDGNINILRDRDDDFRVLIHNPTSYDRDEYMREVEEYMKSLSDIDIFVASAGFDQGINDWGNLLYPEDYHELGLLMKEFSEKLCSGRRYALMEGGYNHDVLGRHVDAFCRGFLEE